MITGAQPKVLLKLVDGGELLLDENFTNIFGDQPKKYKLIRERDGLINTSSDIKWLEFDDKGKYKSDFKEIDIGRSLIMSPFNQFFTWQTTPVIEIVEKRDDYIKFKTKNSTYELFTLN